MVTTVNAGFEILKSNLEITNLQQSAVSNRQKNIRDLIAKELIVLDTFLTGSYARSTMIAPLKDADIDIFIVLEPKYYNSQHPELILDKIRTILLKTYSNSKISRNGQAVTITFSDFIVDVVPAFNRKGGGYLIPNSYDRNWISTNPKIHAEKMTEANKWNKSKLIPLVKMIKCWNRYNNYPFNSFYLELLTLDILNKITITDYPSGMRYFFNKAQEKIKFKMVDPAGLGNNQVAGLNNIKTVDDAVKLMKNSYNTALNAEKLAKNVYANFAIDEWQKIFGYNFPSYG